MWIVIYIQYEAEKSQRSRQSTTLKRLQWSLVKVKDRSGHNFESCVSPWCLCQSNYSIVQTCNKFSLSSFCSGALIEPTLRSTWENYAYPLCIWFARDLFSVFTAWVPYVNGKMSLKHGKSISYRLIFIASVRNSFFVFVGYGQWWGLLVCRVKIAGNI